MKLIQAIRTKNKKAVKEIVTKAVKVYSSSEPVATTADTVYGEMDIRMLDKKSKWQIADATLASIMRKVQEIDTKQDIKVETAKIIATSQLRILFDNINSTNDFL